VPFFPLGGFPPVLRESLAAARLEIPSAVLTSLNAAIGRPSH
jgi:hypothetical protein